MFRQLNSNFCRIQKTERSYYTTLNCTFEAKIFACSRPKFPTPHIRLLMQKFSTPVPHQILMCLKHIRLQRAKKRRAPHIKAAIICTTYATYVKIASSLKTFYVQHIKSAIGYFHNVQPLEKAHSRAFWTANGAYISTNAI